MPSCTTPHDMCPQCQSKVSHSLSKSHLECPPATYPVIFTFTYTGTTWQARDQTTYITDSLAQIFSRPIPVHAAVRRCPGNSNPNPNGNGNGKGNGNGHRYGSWYDVTTPLPQPPGGMTKGKFDYYYKDPDALHRPFRYPRYLFLTHQLVVQKMEARHNRLATKFRELSVLVDFPEMVSREVIDLVVRMFDGRVWTVVGEPRGPEDVGHASLYRMEWWAKTHPLERDNEEDADDQEKVVGASF
ncbi:hypothetical protein BJX61DRAFT_547372 [Aspergillus egyptiacus]|nr:hypothetical protein BJX61DRAFT_547372 [Aspergillus egyptiacus]